MTGNLKLNSHQRNNITLLTPITLELLKAGDWTRTPSSLMECVICGKGISTYIMRFFDWDGAKFKCYECQKNHKRIISPSQ